MSDEITTLVKKIKQHQDLYYAGMPEITDAEFDALWDRLKVIDPTNPLLKVVGKDDSATFVKRKHLMMMGSQQKASDADAFKKWAIKMGYATFLVEQKCDGISLEIQYQKGAFAHAVTRGDGLIGEDISPNVRKMHGFVSHLASDFTGAIRGEILMSHAVFAAKYKDQANCRNMAAGIAKRKDGAGAGDLMVKVYDAIATEGASPFSTELEKMQWLRDQCFDAVECHEFNAMDAVITYRDSITPAVRKTMDYDIDGLVVKGNEIDIADMQRDRPMKQIAFKFPVQEVITILKEVEWSESGAIFTPVAIVEPVEISGATIRRASLANPDLMKKLGVKIGDHVLISRRGEIIPKIEKVTFSPPTAIPIVIPDTCACGVTLVNDGTMLYCPNPKCPKKAYHRLRKWLDTLNIKDIGDSTLTTLFTSGLVTHIADFYKITPTQVEKIGIGAKVSEKIVKHLRETTEIPLWTFVAGFDIEGVGETILEKVVRGGFDKLSLIHDADPIELAKISGVGAVASDKIHKGMTELYNDMLDVYKTKIFTIQKPTDLTGPLKGKSFCFTGALTTLKRSEAQDLVLKKGGEVKNSVVKGLTYLITNDATSGSAKNEAAKKLGVKIVDETTFLTMIK